MKLEELRREAARFAEHLERVKAKSEAPWWGWYPYPMLPGFLHILDRLLTGDHRRLLEEPAGRRVADIGAADGDFGFFLQSVGFEVDLIDGGDESIRELRLTPARTLKEALGSSVEIHGVDLDRDFELPRRYDLVFFLGVLYHLRNPFLALDTLGRYAHHCILSSKVARYLPGSSRFGRRRRVDILERPVAYLLEPYEVNPDDASNYWVFSEAGLRRLFDRAGWTVLDFITVGNPEAEPASEQEARAWCLLRSERADG